MKNHVIYNIGTAFLLPFFVKGNRRICRFNLPFAAIGDFNFYLCDFLAAEWRLL